MVQQRRRGHPSNSSKNNRCQVVKNQAGYRDVPARRVPDLTDSATGIWPPSAIVIRYLSGSGVRNRTSERVDWDTTPDGQQHLLGWLTFHHRRARKEVIITTRTLTMTLSGL